MCYINKIQLSATVCCPIWTGQQPKQIRLCSGLERKAGCSNTSRGRPKSYKKVVTAPIYTHGSRWESHGSSEMTIINGCPVSQLSFRWPYAVPVRVIYTILSTQILKLYKIPKARNCSCGRVGGLFSVCCSQLLKLFIEINVTRGLVFFYSVYRCSIH